MRQTKEVPAKPAAPPKAPHFSRHELEACGLWQIELAPEDEWSALRFSGLASGDARDARFSEIEWREARLNAIAWERAAWSDCRFTSCDLAGLSAAKITVTRAEFFDCRAKGLLAPESDWSDITWRDCNLAGAHLRFARWKRAHFVDCDLSGSNWSNADARGLIFQNCDLRGANFNFCKLAGADWRGCQTNDVQINAKALPGLICTPLQAAQFAGVLGLDVRWNDEANPA